MIISQTNSPSLHKDRHFFIYTQACRHCISTVWEIILIFAGRKQTVSPHLKNVGMKIEHLAIWADDIERLKQFYTTYFTFTAGNGYFNPKRNFTSCFLEAEEGGARIELMHIPGMPAPASRGNLKGLAHFALSVGNRETVNSLTERLRKDGHTILSEPRTTGDGYYESAVADPEGNVVEITE